MYYEEGEPEIGHIKKLYKQRLGWRILRILMAESQLIIATQQRINGVQRKLAWFKRGPTDLYFDVGGCFMGSHTSYHKDGIFITSPAFGVRTVKVGTYLPLGAFKGWYQLGVAMILKSSLGYYPPLKAKDNKKHSLIHTIDLEAYPSLSINFVIELLAPDAEHLLMTEGVQPPPNAEVTIIRHFVPWLVLTTLGHDHNQVVLPADKGILLLHLSSRYSANRAGQTYIYEASKYD